MAFSIGYLYRPLNKEWESPTPRVSKANSKDTWRKIAIPAGLATLVIIIILSSSFGYNRWVSTERPNKTNRPCGETPAQAIEAGCKFDVMMDSWLPENCFDEPLTNQFRKIKDWRFYADKDGTQPLSEEGLSMSQKAHTTLEYHYIHCIFSLRKLHRAIEQGRDVEVEVGGYGHTNHCAGFLERTMLQLNSSQGYSLEQLGTVLNVAYPDCINARALGLDSTRWGPSWKY